ncbi:MAG: glutamate-5-semialdehyde dehydrogenase [Patescibacteria group bacterium]|jgi:glutamate-5-semialdehyde dehydrogenase
MKELRNYQNRQQTTRFAGARARRAENLPRRQAGRQQKKILSVKHASAGLIHLSLKQKSEALSSLAIALVKNSAQILKANKADIKAAKKYGKSDSFIERLALDKEKIKNMADSLRAMAKLPDYIGEVMEEKSRPSGIRIKKVRAPLGLVAIIYESRPNVTVDAFSLAFKSGNGIILKGGKEIKNTNLELVKIIKAALKKHGVNPEIILDLTGLGNPETLELMADKNIDCLIPRGGKGLIEFVRENAKIPVIITGASVVHAYVDEDADLELARRVIINAKTRRVSICNALDVLLLHKKISQPVLGLLAKDLSAKGVEIRANQTAYRILKKLNYPKLKPAGTADFDTEFLDYILAVKIVNDLDKAIKHIQTHTLGHSEAIITRSKSKAEKFFKAIDAACLYHNTSTQFSDGGEFGLGSEIGISTQKLHARGPFAHEALTTYKYIIESKGITRR